MSVKRWTTLAIRYNTTLLLTTLVVYVYRDVWPLGTYTEQPKDTSRDSLLWYKFALLVFTGVVVPLFVPRRYIPVDPQVRLFFCSFSRARLKLRLLVEPVACAQPGINLLNILADLLFLSQPRHLQRLSGGTPGSGSTAAALRH